MFLGFLNDFYVCISVNFTQMTLTTTPLTANWTLIIGLNLLFCVEILSSLCEGSVRMKCVVFVLQGMAFSLEERLQLGIHGLLPPCFLTQDVQVLRVLRNYDLKKDDLDR